MRISTPAPPKRLSMLLILRDLDRLRTFVRAWLADADYGDANLSISIGFDLVEPDDGSRSS